MVMRIEPTPPAPPGRADRVALGRPATMRDPTRAPIDVLVENLSETGALLRTEAALPVGTLVSLGIAGLGMQLARVVRAEPRAAAIAFMVPLEPQAVARAAATPLLTATAIPQLPVERPGDAAVPAPRDEAAPLASFTRLPVAPLPLPAAPLTYDAAGVAPAIDARVVEPPAPDARALWMASPAPSRLARPGPAAWLIAAVALLAALVWLLA